MGTQTESPPPLFTKREKYALAVLTITFVVASALVHLVLGGFCSTLLPHFQPEASASIRPVTIDTLASPTPSPTPPPVPTPHVIASTVPHEQNTVTPRARPVHSPNPSASSSDTPGRDTFPTGPPVISPPTSQPVVAQRAIPTATPGPVQIVDSDFIRKVTPDYPDIAKDENIEGTVTVRVTIGPDGQVADAVITQSSGNALLDDAALRAARDSVFKPPLFDGTPTTREYLIIYTFSLDSLDRDDLNDRRRV